MTRTYHPYVGLLPEYKKIIITNENCLISLKEGNSKLFFLCNCYGYRFGDKQLKIIS